MGGRCINITFLLLSLLFALPASAQARTVLLEPDGTTAPKVQSWIDNAKVPTPDVTYNLVWGDCPFRPNLIACVKTGSNRTIYLSSRTKRIDVLHEVGHIEDRNRVHITGNGDSNEYNPSLNPWANRRFLELTRGSPLTPPEEAWAISYSYCAVFGNRIPSKWRFVWNATEYTPWRNHRKICWFIRNLYPWPVDEPFKKGDTPDPQPNVSPIAEADPPTPSAAP